MGIDSDYYKEKNKKRLTKLRELEAPRGQKVEYVGILIFWLKKHIQRLESKG